MSESRLEVIKCSNPDKSLRSKNWLFPFVVSSVKSKHERSLERLLDDWRYRELTEADEDYITDKIFFTT